MSEKQDGGVVCPDEDDAKLRATYGEFIIISRVDQFTLIHFDSPTEELVRQRVEEFDPTEFFFEDCPLCAIAKAEGGHIIFDQLPDTLIEGIGGESDGTSS